MALPLLLPLLATPDTDLADDVMPRDEDTPASLSMTSCMLVMLSELHEGSFLFLRGTCAVAGHRGGRESAAARSSPPLSGAGTNVGDIALLVTKTGVVGASVPSFLLVLRRCLWRRASRSCRWSGGARDTRGAVHGGRLGAARLGRGLRGRRVEVGPCRCATSGNS